MKTDFDFHMISTTSSRNSTPTPSADPDEVLSPSLSFPPIPNSRWCTSSKQWCIRSPDGTSVFVPLVTQVSNTSSAPTPPPYLVRRAGRSVPGVQNTNAGENTNLKESTNMKDTSNSNSKTIETSRLGRCYSDFSNHLDCPDVSTSFLRIVSKKGYGEGREGKRPRAGEILFQGDDSSAWCIVTRIGSRLEIEITRLAAAAAIRVALFCRFGRVEGEREGVEVVDEGRDREWNSERGGGRGRRFGWRSKWKTWWTQVYSSELPLVPPSPLRLPIQNQCYFATGNGQKGVTRGVRDVKDERNGGWDSKAIQYLRRLCKEFGSVTIHDACSTAIGLDGKKLVWQISFGDVALQSLACPQTQWRSGGCQAASQKEGAGPLCHSRELNNELVELAVQVKVGVHFVPFFSPALI
ncbi:hypothetical protein F5880DRAFT_1510144 [Lentinula raphanica]|nr:hypothetical protein F5880DRAFT_1510144 [Lentinula raphanica]